MKRKGESQKSLSLKGKSLQEQLIGREIQKGGVKGERRSDGEMESALVRKGIYVWVSAAQWDAI